MAKFNELFKEIPIENLFPSPTNPRKTFKEISLQELAESIKEKGVLMPVLVRPVKHKYRTGGKEVSEVIYEIVAGERRYRASILAGQKIVPCRVETLTDDQVLEIQVIENLQREDVNGMEEAQGYKALLDRGRVTIEDIALKVGKSTSYVTTRLKFNDLIPDLQKLFLEEKIQISHANELCRLTPADQKECLKSGLIENTWDGNAKQVQYITPPAKLKNFIKRNITLNLDKAPFKKEDENLVKSAGACITCVNRSGYNKTLFHDIQDNDRCFNKSCYEKKIDAFITSKEDQLKAAGEKYKYIYEFYTPDEDLKKKFPGVIGNNSYKDIRQGEKSKAKCEHTVKGIYVSGEKQGHVINICCNQDCKLHYFPSSSRSSNSSTPESRINQKLERGRELYEEKVQANISAELATNPFFNDENPEPGELKDSETIAMLYMLLDELQWQQKKDVIRDLKLCEDPEDYETEELLQSLGNLSDIDLAFLVRKLIKHKYLHYTSPKAAGSIIVRNVAAEHGVDIESIKWAQFAVWEKKESRLLSQLEELEEEKAAAAPEKKSKKEKKSKLGKALEELIQEEEK